MTFTEKQVRAVRDAFPDAWAERNPDQPPSDWAPACLSERAEAVDEMVAGGPAVDDPFTIQIRGVGGAYFWQSSELGPSNVTAELV